MLYIFPSPFLTFYLCFVSKFSSLSIVHFKTGFLLFFSDIVAYFFHTFGNTGSVFAHQISLLQSIFVRYEKRWKYKNENNLLESDTTRRRNAKRVCIEEKYKEMGVLVKLGITFKNDLSAQRTVWFYFIIGLFFHLGSSR